MVPGVCSNDMTDEHQKPTTPSFAPPSLAEILFTTHTEAVGLPPAQRQAWADLSDAYRRGWQAVAEAKVHLAGFTDDDVVEVDPA